MNIFLFKVKILLHLHDYQVSNYQFFLMFLSSIIFLLCCLIGFYFFILKIKNIYRNICLGTSIGHIENKYIRWNNLLRVAFGQSKMFHNFIIGFLHLLIYCGFFIINLEFLEILIDGIFRTNRFFLPIFGIKFYSIFTLVLEIFSLIVLVTVIIFFIRRNIFLIKRFSFDLDGFPKNDANIILIIEFFLILSFLMMNASFYFLNKEGLFPISTFIFSFIKNYSIKTLFFFEKFSWWFHFLGILFFLNYLCYSKHLHIFLAFPSVYFSNINLPGKFTNLKSVTREVQLILNPSINIDLYNSNNINTQNCSSSTQFGASDIFDLNRVQLLHAYTCTECGRCSAVCPASLTGKKLSPRKILMSIRDRLEEVGKNIDLNKGVFIEDKKKLIGDYISHEEIWACTTCHACIEACPILLDPLSIIIEMRRYLVMENSTASQELNLMMVNIENNGAPWKFNQQDREDWTQNITDI